ncbi:hypothetical protein [Kribbella sp. NPDC050470]|uniref:hypothetical protein n=1 Tax=unclassified Kribbella TaxID=2644121 RepID=UPI0037B6B12A
MHEQMDAGASFTTTRRRPVVVGVITALLAYALLPRGFSYDRETFEVALFLNLVGLVCLVTAVRSWRLVLRRPAELRLTPAGLTVKRSGHELSVPWHAVGQIRIDGDLRRPWVVAWFDPGQEPSGVPAARRRDGAYLLFPVGHGQSVVRRGQKLRELRAAIIGYGRRWVDEVV